jgi:Fic family protein
LAIPDFHLTPFRPADLETPAVFRRVTEASRQLAEFKGVVATIPNERILLSSLALQEAKDSSEIENIVTTHDELFRQASGADGPESVAAKEVLRYRHALQLGWDLVREHGLITNNHLLRIQRELEPNKPGFRKTPGTRLEDQNGRVVYTPPQDANRVVELMNELETDYNAEDGTLDPLVRMAVLHHRFESIHPFHDGNGRAGRILNVLFLLKEGLLDLPVLYMSGPIVRSKSEYYRLLQAVRDHGAWEEWALFMLGAVAESARSGITLVTGIRSALLEVKHRVRRDFHKFYSQDLVNNLFAHPYTKIQFVEDELGVTRVTAAKYLDALAEGGVLTKMKVGRNSYYINERLVELLTAPASLPASQS